MGPPGSGRSHVARAIHYKTNRGQGTLLPIDCRVTREDPLRQAMETLGRGGDPAALNTLLLEGLDSLAVELQQMLAEWLKGQQSAFRVIGISAATSNDSDRGILPSVRDALATMTISIPRLRDRLEDLPILAQFFLESCNRDKVKQVGGIAPEALDLLSLYDWPGELDQLRGVIAEAHAACQGYELAAGDLPRLIHQAAQAAAQPRKAVEKVDLDNFLSSIERELIERALRQAGGNKTEAAELLGMTRPRLYRRLQQCGLDDNPEGENNGETS
jgi:DNA-binding NtrC family response regulator